MHRVLPDFSLFTQWFGGLPDAGRPLGRAKRRARVFVLVVAVLLMMAALAAAAPHTSRWWTSFHAQDEVETKIEAPRENPFKSPKVNGLEKPREPVVTNVEPSAPVAIPEAPVVASSGPSVAKTGRSGGVAPTTPVDDVPDEPAVVPSASPAQSPSPQTSNGQTRITADLALVNEAQALVGTNPSEALKLLARHEREFPASPTSLSRELLYVKTLQQMGRISEARARAKANLDQARGRSTEGKWQQQVDSLQ